MANNKISSSRREIYTKMLDIAEKYTNIKDTDFLKTGLFGYMTETMAMMMRDSTFHKSMMYNESFLNTAVLPKSVYNWAKMFNIEVQKATPKYANINIIIPLSSLKSLLESKKYTNLESKYGITGETLSELLTSEILILDRDDPILAGEYYFSLERSILIRKNQKDKGDSETYTAEYIMGEPVKTKFESLNSSNLITKIINDNLVITARLYQYQMTTSIFKVTTTTFLNKVHRVKFEDQFCGASLFYEEYNGTYKEIPLFYSDMKKNIGTRCAFYNLTDSNELEIIFKNGEGYFMPSANTNLRISVYTTKAESAPLAYTGDAIMIFKDSDLKSLPLIIQFNPSNLIGGKNQPDLTTIKQTIIREISTRDVITTQSDLNNFFAILMSFIEDVNDGKIKFIKKRDDIVKRSFNSYLLLRDNTNNGEILEKTGVHSLNAVIPTNTLDVKFTGEDINKKITDKEDGTHKILDYAKFNYDGTMLLNDAIDDFYISPFLISITDGDYKFVKYIYNMTDSTADLIVNKNSNTNNDFYIIPNTARLFRGFNDSGTSGHIKPESYYKLYLTTTTNRLIGENLDDPNEKGKSITGGSIKISEYSGKNKIETISIDSENNISVYGKPLEGNVYETIFEIKIPVSKPEFYYSDTDSNSLKYYNKINLGSNAIPFSSSARIVIDFSDLKIDSNNLTGFELETTSKLVFFEHLDNYMESGVILDKGNIVGLKDVPLVHSSFFNGENNTTKRENFVKQLFTYIEILKTNIERLETTSFFNIKFYNTYGLSNLYYTDTTNLQLDLNIVLDEQYQNKKDSLETQIRAYIRKLVDKMNDLEVFNLTDIISSVANDSTYGKYIKYIKFIGLNGTFNQYINRLSGEELEEGNYTPEWLNIDYESLMSKTEGSGIFFTYE